MLHITLSGHWSLVIILNVHAPTEDKIDDTKDGFHEGLHTASFQSVPKVTYKNFVRRFQCKSREKRYFKTNNHE